MHPETAPLLPQTPALDVQPLGYRNLWHAIKTAESAFRNGSLVNYLRAANTAPFSGLCWRLGMLFAFAGNIYQRRMLSIDGGAAFLLYSRPEDMASGNQPPWFIRFFTSILNKYGTTEYFKRKDELSAALRAGVEDAFGATFTEMYEIKILATAPEAQGRGYGKRLVKAVTNMGDADGRDTWVVTSDTSAFYEALGFVVVRPVTLGENNTAWDGGLVNMHILRRVAMEARVVEAAPL